MKQIDKLILKSFVGPFLATFFIALFVLTLQVLWVYIDELIGRGLGITTLSEMIFYLSVSLVPQALPIAVLISAVMVYGSLAENYELTAFKSAGSNLMRVMIPGIIFVFGVSVLSFFSSNNFIPLARLQFVSRMYDIRQKKSTLSLEAQAFNDDFKGYSIYIGSKNEEKETISDILIYDQNDRSTYSMIAAEKGKMYNINNGQFFVLKLFNGTRYEEMGKINSKNNEYSRTSFKEYTKIFDLSEFDLGETNKTLFSSNEKMLNATQLYHAIDSIGEAYIARDNVFQKLFIGKYHFEKKRDTSYFNQVQKEQKEKQKKSNDHSGIEQMLKDKTKTTLKKAQPKKKKKTTPPKSKKRKKYKESANFPKHLLECPIATYDNYLDVFEFGKQASILSRAKSSTRTIKNKASNINSQLKTIRKKQTKHILLFYDKFSLALICLVFLFIGGPMGAIVKKGGFGLPILIAIIFFVIYMMLNIFFQKRAEMDMIDPHLAAWLPTTILVGISTILTYLALKDVSFAFVKTFFIQIGNLLKSKSQEK